jgi:heme-degrading monooxygenase HmoA
MSAFGGKADIGKLYSTRFLECGIPNITSHERCDRFCVIAEYLRKGFAMADILEGNTLVTQITTVKLPPDKQDEVVNLMTERARFMAKQPGFVSIALHRSKDGSHVVNYVQWRDADLLASAHHSSEFRKKWPQFGKIADEIEPCLYDLVHVEAVE